MKPFDRVIAISQLFMLVAWEALGVFGFGLNGWLIAATWFVGLWSFNVLTATAVRTYYKLITPQAVVNNVTELEPVLFDEEEDIGA